MAEYIEREAAFNAILKLVPKVDDDGYCWVIRGDAAMAIDSIPAADVVARDCYDRLLAENDELRKERPVVRCGECEYWLDNGTDLCSCDRDALLRRRNFFCADGKRKDGGGDA